MPIPTYQAIMLPLLTLAGDGAEHAHKMVLEALGDYFGLSSDERAQLLPSGKQALFDNRVQWARSYLKHAGLLESTGRAKFRITARGKDVLAQEPPTIDNALLSQFPEFVAFVSSGTSTSTTINQPTPGGQRAKHSAEGVPPASTQSTAAQTATPQELLEASHRQLRAALAREVLDRVREVSPSFLERLVLDLLVRMGYGGSLEDAAQAVGGTGDGGIDGIIKEDRLGLDAIYVQAKRWNGKSVGEPAVRDFAGSLMKHKASKGVFLTTAEFTADARAYVTHLVQKIVLIGGEELARLMIDHGVGVTETAVLRIHRVDTDYFEEG